MPRAKTQRKVDESCNKANVPYKQRTAKARKPVASTTASSAPVGLFQNAAPPLPGPSTGAVLFRTVCAENVRERYPDIEVRNDYDLIELSGRHYKGTPAEIYEAVDKRLAREAAHRGYEFTMDSCTKTLDTYVEPTGIKPKASACDSKFVLVHPIPDSTYSLRLFPGSLSAAEYCLDFVETATGKPVNSPFEYELWGIPNPDADTPWLCFPMVGKLRTIERGHGVKPEDLEPGAEKFVLRDGQTCVLIRPGKRSLRFTVPVRRVKREAVVDDGMDVADFPRYLDV